MSDQDNQSSGLRSFEDFVAELEADNPDLVEHRILREEAEAFWTRTMERLENARGEVSQAEVARRMGLRTASRVAQLENGDADVPMAALYRYARALGYLPVISFVPAAAPETGQSQVDNETDRPSLAADPRKPKRKRDYGGQRVESLVTLENGLGEVPAGTRFTVDRWQRGGGHKQSGLVLKSDPCSCCGIRFSISNVPEHEVRLLDQGSKQAGPDVGTLPEGS